MGLFGDGTSRKEGTGKGKEGNKYDWSTLYVYIKIA
jgi:hypothetical protein